MILYDNEILTFYYLAFFRGEDKSQSEETGLDMLVGVEVSHLRSVVDALEMPSFTVEKVVPIFAEFLQSNKILAFCDAKTVQALTVFVETRFNSGLKVDNKRTLTRTTVEKDGTKYSVYSRIVVSSTQ